MLPQITPIFEFFGLHVTRGFGLIIRINLNLNLSNLFLLLIVLTTKVIVAWTQILAISIFHGI